jgi:hypothetical protein
MRSKVECGEVSSKEAVMPVSRSIDEPPDFGQKRKDMMERRGAARSEGIFRFAGTAMTVGDAALFSELGFLQRIRRAKPESGAMSCSEAVAGMHNNGRRRFDHRVMRRGGELLGDGVRE